MKDEPVGVAQAWNRWWSSVSTGTNDKHMATAFEAGYRAAEQAAAERERVLVEALELFLKSTHEHNEYCSIGAIYNCNCLLGEANRTARQALATIKENSHEGRTNGHELLPGMRSRRQTRAGVG